MTSQQPAPPPDEGKTNQRIATALNRCIEACLDGEKTYALAAADARQPELKRLFLQFERDRAESSLTLQRLVAQLRLFPMNEGTTRGAASRMWSAVVRVTRGRGDRLILEQCLGAERHTMNAYAEAFRDSGYVGVPIDVRSVIDEQFAACESAAEELSRRINVAPTSP